MKIMVMMVKIMKMVKMMKTVKMMKVVMTKMKLPPRASSSVQQ